MTALRRGVDDKEFVLDYQPIVELSTGRVSAIEALLRWNHPAQGRLLPKDFIRLAEHTGLITPLTSFAVERSLADWVSAALAPPPFRIAVNLSPRSLNDPAFPGRVQRMLSARGASPEWLALEITENLIMSDPERSIKSLTELHEMGIRLILDDFGTGYSSLSYLRRFPVDELKIDQSFVIGLAGGEDEALVRSIIGLAHNLQVACRRRRRRDRERARPPDLARLRRGAGPLHLPAGERVDHTRSGSRPPRSRAVISPPLALELDPNRATAPRRSPPISCSRLVSFSCSARTKRVYGATASITPRTLLSTSRSNCARRLVISSVAHRSMRVAQLRLWRARASTESRTCRARRSCRPPGCRSHRPPSSSQAR